MIKYNKLSIDSRKKRDLATLKSENKKTIEKIRLLLDKIKDIPKKELIKSVIDEKEKIPISIFQNKLSPLEAITQYLVEQGNTLRETAYKLKRDERTIWTTYQNAKKKKVTQQTDSEEFIPLEILANRRLSILENICKYLKEKRWSNKAIGEILGRSSQTIWITLSRAENKLK